MILRLGGWLPVFFTPSFFFCGRFRGGGDNNSGLLPGRGAIYFVKFDIDAVSVCAVMLSGNRGYLQ